MAAPAARYLVAGRPMTCRECTHDTFYTRRTLLNTRGLTFLGWDVLNKDAANYICARCGHLTWYVERGPDGRWIEGAPRPVTPAE